MFLEWLFQENDNSNDFVINSILPLEAKNKIDNDILPTFITSTIILNENEKCHYIERAILITEEKQKEKKIFRTGNSIRIMKGWTIHFGKGNLTPKYRIINKYSNGIIYVTNKRIVFSSNNIAFDNEINRLSSIIPYTDGIGLQFGTIIYNILIPNHSYIVKIINMIINTKFD